MTDLVTAAAIFLAVAAAALGLRFIAIRTLRRWSAATQSPFSELILDSLRVPSFIWCILIGLYTAIDTVELPTRPSATALKLLFSLLVISMTIAIANIAGGALRLGLRQNQVAIPSTGLSLTALKATIWIIGALVLLSGLGISVAPLLTALGVGGLAVALALQDTLSNFFAGIHLLMERPIRVGDFIRLENGQEGYVEDISWRTTRIRMLPNNMVIVPNAKLSQSIVTNYYLPEPRMAVLIPISVSYQADPDHIERLLVEEASGAVGHLAGLLAEPAPFVRFIPGFGASSLDFTLICHVREFTDQFLIQHELRKRILKRFKAEQIQFPVAQQMVYVQPAERLTSRSQDAESRSQP